MPRRRPTRGRWDRQPWNPRPITGTTAGLPRECISLATAKPKTAYRTRADAEHDLEGINQRNRRHGRADEPMHVYQCGHCFNFHIGHPVQEQT